MVVRERDLKIKESEFPELTRRVTNNRSWNRIGRLGTGCVGLETHEKRNTHVPLAGKTNCTTAGLNCRFRDSKKMNDNRSLGS